MSANYKNEKTLHIRGDCMVTKGLKKIKIVTMCLACLISFPVTGTIPSYANEMKNTNVTSTYAQPSPLSGAVNYLDYAQKIHKILKESINGTEPFIETGIQVRSEELSDLCFYIQMYYLGETPKVYYVYQYETPEVGRIQIKRENVKTCIEQHEEALKQLQKIVDDAAGIQSKDEKMLHYASVLHDNNIYDYSHTNSTVYQLLKNKKGICHAYTTAFGWLCKLSDIPVLYIEGKTEGPHAWNQVMLSNGEWKYIDVTNLFISPTRSYIEPDYYKQHFTETMRYVMYKP